MSPEQFNHVVAEEQLRLGGSFYQDYLFVTENRELQVAHLSSTGRDVTVIADTDPESGTAVATDYLSPVDNTYRRTFGPIGVMVEDVERLNAPNSVAHFRETAAPVADGDAPTHRVTGQDRQTVLGELGGRRVYDYSVAGYPSVTHEPSIGEGQLTPVCFTREFDWPEVRRSPRLLLGGLALYKALADGRIS